MYQSHDFLFIFKMCVCFMIKWIIQLKYIYIYIYIYIYAELLFSWVGFE